MNKNIVIKLIAIVAILSTSALFSSGQRCNDGTKDCLDFKINIQNCDGDRKLSYWFAGKTGDIWADDKSDQIPEGGKTENLLIPTPFTDGTYNPGQVWSQFSEDRNPRWLPQYNISDVQARDNSDSNRTLYVKYLGNGGHSGTKGEIYGASFGSCADIQWPSDLDTKMLDKQRPKVYDKK